MWILSFLLLTWFPAVLHGETLRFCLMKGFYFFLLFVCCPLILAVSAQGAAGSCARPELTHGFLVPDLQSYPENSVTYACDDGFKSAMESWWGTTTCQNGKWFPEPFCIGRCSMKLTVNSIFQTVSLLNFNELYANKNDGKLLWFTSCFWFIL